MDSIDDSRRPESLVARTARTLAGLSLEHADGAFIGAEERLLGQLGVSRPTLRQAAKIAENDGLIRVRRGVRGGYYAARPDAGDAIRTLVRYLRLRGAGLADILAVHRLVAEEAAALACGCTNSGLRGDLEAAASRIAAADSAGALIRAETALARLVARMSGNPAIELVMAIDYSFGMEARGVSLYRAAGQRAEARRLQQELCRAILAGDAEVARLMMRRRSAAMAGWVGAAAVAGGEPEGECD